MESVVLAGSAANWIMTAAHCQRSKLRMIGAYEGQVSVKSIFKSQEVWFGGKHT